MTAFVLCGISVHTSRLVSFTLALYLPTSLEVYLFATLSVFPIVNITLCVARVAFM